jgi:hypothetical protein
MATRPKVVLSDVSCPRRRFEPPPATTPHTQRQRNRSFRALSFGPGWLWLGALSQEFPGRFTHSGTMFGKKPGLVAVGRLELPRALLDRMTPLRLPHQVPIEISASALISSVPTARAGGPGGVPSLLPLRCPCMLPPSPRGVSASSYPRLIPADTSLRPTTRGSATPLPALAAPREMMSHLWHPA